jgi:hypothetical protein
LAFLYTSTDFHQWLPGGVQLLEQAFGDAVLISDGRKRTSAQSPSFPSPEDFPFGEHVRWIVSSRCAKHGVSVGFVKLFCSCLPPVSHIIGVLTCPITIRGTVNHEIRNPLA